MQVIQMAVGHNCFVLEGFCGSVFWQAHVFWAEHSVLLPQFGNTQDLLHGPQGFMSPLD
jgi:hypothetical protein